MSLPFNEIQKDALIQLYADNTINVLDNQPTLITLVFGGVQNINSISDIENKIPEYKVFMTYLRTIKNNIEQITVSEKQAAQVRYCLIQLSNIIEQDDEIAIDIFNKIVERMLLQGAWSNSPNLVEKYREISAIVQTWNHFFVSYTTRDTPAVNNLYEPELFKQFDPDIVKKELVGNNLVAKYIVKCFKRYNSLKVFFDRESIVCGDIIKEEVFEYCEKTFAFVQLIEDISFHKEKGYTNWCHTEYERFKMHNQSNQKSKHFFIIEGFDINPAIIPPPYLNWAQDILDTKYEKINRPFDVTSIKKKCQEYTERIKKRRAEYINELIKSVA